MPVGSPVWGSPQLANTGSPLPGTIAADGFKAVGSPITAVNYATTADPNNPLNVSLSLAGTRTSMTDNSRTEVPDITQLDLFAGGTQQTFGYPSF